MGQSHKIKSKPNNKKEKPLLKSKTFIQSQIKQDIKLESENEDNKKNIDAITKSMTIYSSNDIKNIDKNLNDNTDIRNVDVNNDKTDITDIKNLETNLNDKMTTKNKEIKNDNNDIKDIETKNDNNDIKNIDTNNDKNDINDIETKNKNNDTKDIETKNDNSNIKNIDTNNDKNDINDIEKKNKNNDTKDIETKNDNSNIKDIEKKNDNSEIKDVETKNDNNDIKNIDTNNDKNDINDIEKNNKNNDTKDIETKNDNNEIKDIETKNDNNEIKDIEIINDNSDDDDSDTIKTYLNIYDITHNLTFSYDKYMIIGKIENQKIDEDNSQKIKSLTIDIYKDSVVGKIKDIDDDEEKMKIVKQKSGVIDKYDIMIFLIKYQKYISLINYKLNRNIPLTDFELKIKKILKNKKINLLLNEIKSDLDDDLTIEEYESQKFIIPDIFYGDIDIIKKKNEVKDINDQLKFDIYNQMENKKKSSIYEDELKVVYKYYISQLYKKVSIGYSIRNDGKICEEEIIGELKKISSKKKIVVYC